MDLEWLRTYRDQLLGEAVMRYRDGERWWLSNHQEAKQQKQNKRYLYANSYTKAAEALHRLLPEGAAFTTELVAATLGVPVRDHHYVRRSLESAGWKVVRTAKWRGWSNVATKMDLTWEQRIAMGRIGMSKLSDAWDEMFRLN
tara:strand:+ start:127 stop:555 length:429 start_codon:yes stop_codon:yes gene_type:complete